MDVNRVGRSLVMFMVLGAGCASSPWAVPEPIQSKINQTVTFSQILDHPENYVGMVVVIGGEVLNARRLHDGTQLEVLQLPLDDSHRPTTQRTASQGRFLALEKTSVDPATFSKNTRVTLVGKVTGSKVAPLDESEYRFPTLEVAYLQVWDPEPVNPPQGYGVGLGLGGGGVGMGTGF